MTPWQNKTHLSPEHPTEREQSPSLEPLTGIPGVTAPEPGALTNPAEPGALVAEPGRGRGRPPKLVGGHLVRLYLDDESVARARSLGSGNVSEGVRRALLVAMSRAA